MIEALALPGLPDVGPGDDLAGLVARAGIPLEDGDVLVVSHKVVSKAEGRLRRLADVSPGARARTLADAQGKDARHVQVVLDESQEVLRAERGVLVCLTPHGFVCANAGVDASNAPEEGVLVLLPTDPDASARALRAGLGRRLGARPAVVVADSFGRAWRHGQSDVAIGCAGLRPLEDRRGEPDAAGRSMRATLVAVADQAAAAADLARTKTSREPAVRVRGLQRHVTAEDGPGAAALLRAAGEDLFR